MMGRETESTLRTVTGPDAELTGVELTAAELTADMLTRELPALDLRGLIQHCLAGHQHAMVELVSRYTAQVFGLCYRMLGHRQDAEDAAQETFVRALKSLHRWDATRSFEPWLLAIAGNRCRTALATRSRRPAQEILHEGPADHRETAGDVSFLAADVQTALQQLRPEHRQAFVLFHEQHQNYAEIAQMMNVPLGTVKTWVHRARRELMDQLAAKGWGDEQRDARDRETAKSGKPNSANSGTTP